MSATIDGTNGFSLNGNQVRPLTQGTSQNSTSGTSIDFTGIPSWAKRITVMLSGVSTNGTAQVGLQLGTASGVENSGYAGALFDSATNTSLSAGLFDNSGNAAAVRNFVFTCVNIGGNTWTVQLLGSFTNAAGTRYGVVNKTLAGTLDRVRITTSNGTDTFDAGTINILYE